jgi:hypothetical protein
VTKRAVSGVIAVVVGALTALFGTGAHRAFPPWGLLLALVATGAGAVFTRALGGLIALFITGFSWLTLVLAIAYLPRGGDVLIVPGVLGYLWLLAPLVLFGVAAFLPARWFTDDEASE